MERATHGRHPTHHHLPAHPHRHTAATPRLNMEGEEGRRNAALRHGRGAGRLRLALPLVLMLLPLAQPFLGASNYGALSACGRPAFALHALRTSSFLPISRCAVLAPDLRATSSRTAAFPLPQLADRHRAARQGAAEVVCMARIPEGRLGYGWHLYPEPMPRRWGVNHVIISEEKTKRRKKILAEFSKKWCTYRGNRWPRATLKFLVEEVGMPSRYITPVWESGCNIRGLNVSSNLRPKVNYLTEEVGIPKSEIGKVVGRYPSILGLSTEGNLKPTVRFLEFVAGIPRDRLGESLSRYPTVLGLSIAGNLDPTLTFLREEAGIPPEMLSRLLAKSPQVLGHSVETSLRPTVTFLRKMGVPREEIGPILGKCPMLLTSSVSDNLAPKVLFFWTSLRIPRLAVAGMMSKYPSLLALNVANTIRPKIALLTDTLNLTIAEARETVIRNPALLARSTEKLLEAHSTLQKRGLTSEEASRLVVASPRLLTHSSHARVTAALTRLDWATRAHPSSSDAKAPRAKGEKGKGKDAGGSTMEEDFRKEAERRRQEAGLRRSPSPKKISEAVKGMLFKRPSLMTASPGTSDASDMPGAVGVRRVGGRSEEDAELLMEVLQKASGMTAKEVRAVLLKCPELLGSNLEVRVRPALAYLQEIGLGQDALRSVLRTSPQMLYLSVAKTIKPKVDFLRDQVGIPSKHLPAVIKRAPRLLFTSVENTLQPNLNFFTQELQVPADKLAETLSKSPSLLTRSLLTHLHPVAAFLSEEAGLSPAAITRLLLDQPQVMMSSLEEKLRTNLTILREHLRLNPSQISRILTSEPKLLGASVDTALSTSLLTKAMFLARQLSLTPEEVGKMACVMPSLLIMSTEGTLRPKIAFLLNDFHALPSDIASFPQALGYSLEGRILPRLEHLVASGADVGAISLPSILAPTNQVFAKRYSPEAIQRRVEKGEDQKRKREAKLSRVPRPPPVPREPRPSPLQNLAPPGKYGGEDWWQEEEVEDEEEWVMRGALALGGGRRRERSNSKLSRNHSALLVLRALTKRYGTARNSESLARVRAAADARLALRAEMLREAGIDPFYALPLDDFDGGRSAVFSSP